MTTPGQPTVSEFWGWSPASAAGGFYQEIPLQQSWLGVSTFGGSRLGIPALRGNDIEVPFRPGQSWRSKYPNSRTITLVCWVAGVDRVTDLPATDQVQAWNDNFQQIRQAFWNRGASGSLRGILNRRWSITQQGSASVVTASAMAEVAGTMDPTMTGRTRADFSVDLLLADPYFYDITPQVAVLGANSTAVLATLGEGVVGEGYPSAVSSFSIVLSGPLATPTLTNATAGVSLTYNAAIGAGHSVVLDILSYTATDDSGANVIGNVRHAGSRCWFALFGGLDSANQVSLSTLSPQDGGTAQITWNDVYI